MSNEAYKLSATTILNIDSVWIDAKEGTNNAFRLQLAQNDTQQANNVRVNDFYVGSSDGITQYGQLWLNGYTGNGKWNLHLGATSYNERDHLSTAALRVDGNDNADLTVATETSGYLETLQDTRIAGSSNAVLKVEGLRGSFKLSLDALGSFNFTITGNDRTNDFSGLLEFTRSVTNLTLTLTGDSVQTVGGLTTSGTETTIADNHHIEGSGTIVFVGDKSCTYYGKFGTRGSYGPSLRTEVDYTGTQAFADEVYAKSLDIENGEINARTSLATSDGGTINGGIVTVGTGGAEVPQGTTFALTSRGDVTVKGGTLTVHGQVGLGDGRSKKGLTVSGGTVTIDGRLGAGGNAAGFAGAVSVTGGALSVGGGGTSSDANSNNMDAWTGAVTVSGGESSMTIAGSLATYGAAITVNDGGTLSVGHAISSASNHNSCTGALGISGGGTVTVGTEGMAGEPDHAGNAYVASLTMDGEGSTLTVKKSLNAGTGTNFNGAVTINGGRADVKGELHAGAVGVTGGNLTVGSTATVSSLTVSGDATIVSVTGLTTVSGAVSVTEGAVTLNDGLTVSSGVVSVTGGEVTVAGAISVTSGADAKNVTIDRGGKLKLSGVSTVQNSQNWTLGNEGILDATEASGLTVAGGGKLTVAVARSTSETGGVHRVGHMQLKGALLSGLQDDLKLTLEGVTDELLWGAGGWTCDLLVGSQDLKAAIKTYESFLKGALQGLSDRTEVTVFDNGNVNLALHTRDLSWNSSGVMSDWKNDDDNNWTWNGGSADKSDFRNGDTVTFKDGTNPKENHDIDVNGEVNPGSIAIEQGSWTFKPSTTAGGGAAVKAGAMSITGKEAHLTLSGALDVEATGGVKVDKGGLLTVSSTGAKKFSVTVGADSAVEATTDVSWDDSSVSGEGALVLTGMNDAHTWKDGTGKTGFLRRMLGAGSVGIGTLELGSGTKLSVSDAGDKAVFEKVKDKLVVKKGATLDVSVDKCLPAGGSQTLHLEGAGIDDSGAALVLSSGAGIGWAVALDGDATVSVTGTSTLSGSLNFGEDTAHTLTKTGAGTLTLAGGASGKGTLDIQTGSVILQAQELDLSGVDVKTASAVALKASADASIKSLSGAGQVTVDKGKNLTIVGAAAPGGAAFTGTLKGQGFVTVEGKATLKLGANAKEEAGFTLRVLGALDVAAGEGGSVELAGTITDTTAPASGSVLKVTSGSLTLKGVVNVSAIQLQSGSKTTISGDKALGGTDTTLTLNGGDLTADGSATSNAGTVVVAAETALGGTLTLTGKMSGGGSLKLSDAGTATLTGDIVSYSGKLNTGNSDANSFTLTGDALGVIPIANEVAGNGSVNFAGTAVFSGDVSGNVTLNETAEGETLTVTSQNTSETAKLGQGEIILGSIDRQAQWKGTSLGDATKTSVITLANVTLGTGDGYSLSKDGSAKLYVATAKGAKKTSPGGVVNVNGMNADSLDGITVNLHGRLTNLAGTYAVGENKELELHFSDDNWKRHNSEDSISVASVADGSAVALVAGKEGNDDTLITRDDGTRTHLVFRSTDLIGALDDAGTDGLEVTALANGKWATSGLIEDTDGIKKWIEAEYSDHTDLIASIITSIQFTEHGLVIIGETEDLYVVRDTDGDKISDDEVSNDPKEVSHEKRAVVLLDGKTLQLNWDGSKRYDSPDHIAVHNLLGSEGTTLKITNSATEDPTGASRLTVYLDNTYHEKVADTRYDESGQELDEPYKTDVHGQNTTFGGKITAAEGVDLTKTGKGTLTVEDTYGVGKGTTILNQGALKLGGKNNELGGLAFAYDENKGTIKKAGGEETETRGLTLRDGSSTFITGSITGADAYRDDNVLSVEKGASLTRREPELDAFQQRKPHHRCAQ